MIESFPHTLREENKPQTGEPKYNFAAGKKTPGEKLFDYTLYGGIGYFLNLGLSLIITEAMLFGKGKPMWEASDRTMTKLLSNMMNAKSASKASNITQKYFWLTSGGTALMIPIKVAEDNKSKITYLLNRTYFPHTISKDDPYKAYSVAQILSSDFDENLLPQPVLEQPKNSWLNTIMRRVFAVGLVTGWGNLTDKIVGNDNIENWSYDAISKTMRGTSGASAEKLIKNPRFERYAKWTIIDGINTMITSLAIYFTSGAGEKKEEEPTPMIKTIPTHDKHSNGNGHHELSGNSHGYKPTETPETSPQPHITAPQIESNKQSILTQPDKNAEVALAQKAIPKDGFAGSVTQQKYHSSDSPTLSA